MNSSNWQLISGTDDPIHETACSTLEEL